MNEIEDLRRELKSLEMRMNAVETILLDLRNKERDTAVRELPKLNGYNKYLEEEAVRRAGAKDLDEGGWT